MDSSALAIINFAAAKPKTYAVPTEDGGSMLVTVGEILEIGDELFEVQPMQEAGKLCVTRVVNN